MRKSQRTIQKTWDYNLGPNSNLSKELEQLARRPAPDNAESSESFTKSIDAMLSKLRGTKRKLGQLGSETTSTIQTAQSRLAYMSSMPSSSDSPAYAPWSRKRLAISMADYFSRTGSHSLKQTASVLAQEEGITDLVDFAIWDELAKAENGVRTGKLEDVLAWVNENKAQLKKMKVRDRAL